MQTIDDKFKSLGSRVNLTIFYGQVYVYDQKNRNNWKVGVQFIDGGTKIEFEEFSPYLIDALHAAYERLDIVVSKGLGANAMLPAIEHKPETKIDDEIPL